MVLVSWRIAPVSSVKATVRTMRLMQYLVLRFAEGAKSYYERFFGAWSPHVGGGSP